MRRKNNNKKLKQRIKGNLKKSPGRKKLFSKRRGGVLNASMLMENRNLNAADFSSPKKDNL